MKQLFICFFVIRTLKWNKYVLLMKKKHKPEIDYAQRIPCYVIWNELYFHVNVLFKYAPIIDYIGT